MWGIYEYYNKFSTFAFCIQSDEPDSEPPGVNSFLHLLYEHQYNV